MLGGACKVLDSLFPPDEAQLRPLRGRVVSVLMKDGARHTGILTSCGKSSIVLNGNAATGPAGRTSASSKRSRRSPERNRKASVKAGPSAERELAAESAMWGALSFGPGSDLTAARVVLPVRAVEAVLLL